MLQIVKEAIEWITAIAADDTHGYTQDQNKRWGPDYDCSSLVISAWQSIGVPVKTNGASYTGNMYDAFIETGFEDVTSSIDFSSRIGGGLLPGDVLVYEDSEKGHAAMFLENAQIVHASGNKGNPETGDQNGGEILVQSYYNNPWTYALRWTR